MIPGYLAGSRVISDSLEQGWLESFQAHFSTAECQPAGAFYSRGFDCRVIVAVAPCPAGTPQPHLCLAPGLSLSPRVLCQELCTL